METRGEDREKEKTPIFVEHRESIKEEECFLEKKDDEGDGGSREKE